MRFLLFGMWFACAVSCVQAMEQEEYNQSNRVEGVKHPVIKAVLLPLEENKLEAEVSFTGVHFEGGFAFIKALERLKENPHLAHLSLAGVALSPGEYAPVINLISTHSSLQSVDLSGTAWEEEKILQLFRALASNTRVDFMNLKLHSALSDKALGKIYEILAPNRTLRNILWPESKGKALEKQAKASFIAALHLGVQMQEKGQQEAARSWFEKAAKAGHRVALYELGVLAEGENPKQAFSLYESASAQDYAPAHYALSRYYRGEWGEETNTDRAFSFCKQAADKGYAPALYRLGRMYEHGRGVIRSLGEAMKLMKSAAFRDHLEAQAALGGMYLEQGNEEQGIFWLQKAANKGNSQAQKMLASLDRGKSKN